MLPPFMSHPAKGIPPHRWRVRPLFSNTNVTLKHQAVYGWNLIDPHGLVRRSFIASLNEVADVARREMKGMRV